ncbi:MAG: hypothetical protein R2856_28830 [Caldilineaceae bacterium]
MGDNRRARRFVHARQIGQPRCPDHRDERPRHPTRGPGRPSRKPLALASDQLYVDFDLSEERNIPPGTRAWPSATPSSKCRRCPPNGTTSSWPASASTP